MTKEEEKQRLEKMIEKKDREIAVLSLVFSGIRRKKEEKSEKHEQEEILRLEKKLFEL